MRLSILYRGPLSSCNYACSYCPFAKHQETAAEHAHDAKALSRFVGWVSSHPGYSLSVFITPWGEALVRRRYQRAIIELSQLAHLERVVIQTNLSARLDWVEECDKEKLALWTTYHPTQVARSAFVAKCHELAQRGVRFSVGIVGFKDQLAEFQQLQAELPTGVYLWVNAYKDVESYYTDEDLSHFAEIDPLFSYNTIRHPSAGLLCHAGERAISVDGLGTIRRCHFIREPLGNLYQDDLETLLRPRPCTNRSCGCHIGYIYLDHLGLDRVFEGGMLERIPVSSVQCRQRNLWREGDN